jgi:hypothetical protein
MNDGDKMTDFVGKIMDFESGNMDDKEFIDFFAELVKTGMAWSLQGTYGRTAAGLIEAEYIDQDGNVLAYPGH